MNICNKCGEAKPLESFAANKRRSTGINTICRTCVSLRMQVWGSSESGKKHKEQYKKNPDVIARRKARKQDAEYKRKQKQYRDRPDVKQALKNYQRSDEHKNKRRDVYRKKQSAQAHLFAAVCRSHGIDVETWARMFNSQNAKCAACATQLKIDRSTAIDHCHSTGAVRGLLCRGCNLALGHTHDDPSRLRCLANYIERSL